MSAYGWFTLGVAVGAVVATLFITTLEALDRRLKWVEALVRWIETQL